MGEPEPDATSQSQFEPEQNQFDPAETTQNHREPDVSSETLLPNGEETNTAVETNNQTEPANSNSCDQPISVECSRDMNSAVVIDSLEDKGREAVEDGNTQIEGEVKAESGDGPDNKHTSSTGDGSPGLVEIMTGRASPLTNTDNINLEDGE